MDIKSTQTLSLDFNKSERKTIKVKQYDKNSRFLKIKCLDSGKFIKLDPTTIHAKVKMLANGDRPVLNNSIVNEDGTITVEFTETMLADPGIAKAELIVVDDTEESLISTMPFDVIVESSVYKNDRVIASEEFNALTNMVVEEQKRIDTMDKLSDDVQAAEKIRVSNENSRKSNETKRVSAESARDAAETTRISNEKSRNTKFESMEKSINDELNKMRTNKIEATSGTNSYIVSVTEKDGTQKSSPNLLNAISIGSVTTGDSDENPTASITGTFGNQKLNLRLPAGKPFKIAKTYPSIANMNSDVANRNMYDFVMIVSSVADEDNAKLYMKTAATVFTFICDLSGTQGVQGVKGDTGATPALKIGKITTVSETSQATATITGTKENPILNLWLPQGKTGKIENVYAGTIPFDSTTDTTTIKEKVSAMFIVSETEPTNKMDNTVWIG